MSITTTSEFLCEDATNLENLDVIRFNDDGELVCLNTVYTDTPKSTTIAVAGVAFFMSMVFMAHGWIPLWQWGD